MAIPHASGAGLSVHNGGKPFKKRTNRRFALLMMMMELQVFLADESGEVIDVYRLKIGVRSLHWNSREFLINGKPIYFRGFGRHEDSDVCFHLIIIVGTKPFLICFLLLF